MENLLNLDKLLFFLINHEWTNPFFDSILPLFRDRFFWAPLYLFLLSFFIINYKKQSFRIIAMFLLTFMLADFTSSSVIKPLVQRTRPCNDPELQEQVRSLIPCGSGYSFTSSHATNHFAMAVFLISLLASRYRWIRWAALAWAASVSYAQVYVGVHFPIDVFCGGMMGAAIGTITGYFTKRNLLYD